MAKRQKVPCNTSNPLIHLDKGTHLWQDLLGNAGCRKPFCPQQTAHLYAGKLIPSAKHVLRRPSAVGFSKQTDPQLQDEGLWDQT
ncbi:uncharacterized protein LOC128853453 isoform X3 [Cuculus canorus]|uniref:uncharacterized protein LOC128853453 isoform X3 n=1 Tax=Cuculus canorus TaxID=55661 RepID=UPI0023AAFE1E|nr:uncharacterized protein LOC128853453 isoform X3 [Cuculus canorus]